jgi:hypothetical protein|tara:strand:+ start:5806 stop:6039 length:234 start_codon:yes stop_codon:yes gene_type:complete
MIFKIDTDIKPIDIYEQRYLDGYCGMIQQSLYDFVTLCYFDAASNEYCEESLYMEQEALRKMKEYLANGVCAWIKRR